ncbi:MAG: hypothetical protein ACRC7C_04335 [Beijerinckiaceae bacterium]
MRRIFAILAFFSVMAGSASAQVYYYPDPYQQPRQRYGPPPGYGDQYQRRQQVGDVCITSRGNCRVNLVPAGSGCRCMIPGFGPKRGNVIASRRGGGYYNDD